MLLYFRDFELYKFHVEDEEISVRPVKIVFHHFISLLTPSLLKAPYEVLPQLNYGYLIARSS